MNPTETTNVPSSLSLVDYAEILVRRWKFIAGLTLTITLATAIYSVTLPNIYTAKAKILPPQQGGGLLSAAMMQGALAVHYPQVTPRPLGKPLQQWVASWVAERLATSWSLESAWLHATGEQKGV